MYNTVGKLHVRESIDVSECETNCNSLLMHTEFYMVNSNLIVDARLPLSLYTICPYLYTIIVFIALFSVVSMDMLQDALKDEGLHRTPALSQAEFRQLYYRYVRTYLLNFLYICIYK